MPTTLQPFAQINDRNVNELLIQQQISRLGVIAPLSVHVDGQLFQREIQQFNSEWKIYNPRKPGYGRMGLSLTSLDGGMSGAPDLDSIFEFNRINGTNYTEEDFKIPTAAAERLTSLHPILKMFSELGRSHLIRFDRGGYFPPHRDAFSLSHSCFRVVVALSWASRSELVFLVDGQQQPLSQWQGAFVETLREHAVFSFADGATLLVLNVPYTVENYQALILNLQIK